MKILDWLVDARIQIVREAEKREETRTILSNIKENLAELKEIQELLATESQKISLFITSADLEHTDDYTTTRGPEYYQGGEWWDYRHPQKQVL